MAQVKIFGLREFLENIKHKISEIIHTSLVSELKIPVEKKFQRFIPLEKNDFIFPSDRTENYIIIEISLFEGREKETIKSLIKNMILKLTNGLNLSPNDIEITVFQTPKYCWGIRGSSGDELTLSYPVNV